MSTIMELEQQKDISPAGEPSSQSADPTNDKETNKDVSDEHVEAGVPSSGTSANNGPLLLNQLLSNYQGMQKIFEMNNNSHEEKNDVETSAQAKGEEQEEEKASTEENEKGKQENETDYFLAYLAICTAAACIDANNLNRQQEQQQQQQQQSNPTMPSSVGGRRASRASRFFAGTGRLQSRMSMARRIRRPSTLRGSMVGGPDPFKMPEYGRSKRPTLLAPSMNLTLNEDPAQVAGWKDDRRRFASIIDEGVDVSEEDQATTTDKSTDDDKKLPSLGESEEENDDDEEEGEKADEQASTDDESKEGHDEFNATRSDSDLGDEEDDFFDTEAHIDQEDIEEMLTERDNLVKRLTENPQSLQEIRDRFLGNKSHRPDSDSDSDDDQSNDGKSFLSVDGKNYYEEEIQYLESQLEEQELDILVLEKQLAKHKRKNRDAQEELAKTRNNYLKMQFDYAQLKVELANCRSVEDTLQIDMEQSVAIRDLQIMNISNELDSLVSGARKHDKSKRAMRKKIDRLETTVINKDIRLLKLMDHRDALKEDLVSTKRECNKLTKSLKREKTKSIKRRRERRRSQRNLDSSMKALKAKSPSVFNDLMKDKSEKDKRERRGKWAKTLSSRFLSNKTFASA